MRVSIYIPTHNRLELLKRAVESVLRQTHEDIEVIVVNDGSSDGTDQYLIEKAASDTRLKFINKPKAEGAPKARNAAIKMATGAFVTGLDDDDAFVETRVAAFLQYWDLLVSQKLQPACLYSQDVIIANGETVRTSSKRGSVNFEDLLEFNYIGNQIFAPKEHFMEAGLFDESLPAWQDLEFFMRVLKKYGQAYLLDIPTQLYDDSPRVDRISVKSEKKIREAFRIVSTKHASHSARAQQLLMIRVFSKFYGIRPKPRDWIHFLRRGFWMGGILRMLRETLRYP